MQKRVDRRRFVTTALGGAMVLALGLQWGRVAHLIGSEASAAGGTQSLVIGDAMLEMVDLSRVYVWAFGTPDGPSVPGPALHALDGDTVRLEITNLLDEPHAFAVQGTSITTGPIPPGETIEFEFVAPPPGTYLYLDPLNAPVNRLLGLAGTMVVLPTSGPTPYRSPSPMVDRLFDNLGRATHFPGEPWVPHRTRIWHLHSIDPRWHAVAQAGGPIDRAKVASDNAPRYFLLNGQSGYFASHDPATVPSGRIGQPHLIRIVNSGVTWNSLHIHGNHVYVTAERGTPLQDVPMIDSWAVAPLSTCDWLLPFLRPPDIPGPAHLPLREVLREEIAYSDEYRLRQTPLTYPMHCHVEPSQTAAGGNYPGGLVTHWEITGDLDGVDFPRSGLSTTRASRQSTARRS